MPQTAREKVITINTGQIQALIQENQTLRKEIRVAREAAEITANLVVKQFEETEKILNRLQIANAHRKAVLESASQISIIATDNNGIINVFNSGAENLLGYRAEMIIGKQTPEIFHLKSELSFRGEELSAKYDRQINGLDIFFTYALHGHGEQLEWTYVRKDGSRFPVNMSISPLKDPDGAISGFLCISMDVSEKKRSEKALKESEQKHRLLIKNIPNIVYEGYMDGSIVFFDDKIEELTGYSKEEFISGRMKWFDIVAPEDREYVRDMFIKALKSDQTYVREYRIRNKKGDLIWIEAGGQITLDADGQIEYITGAFLNITERKLAEAALHESEEKYRSLFSRGPNPIFVIDRESLVILDANPRAEEVYEYSREEMIGIPFPEVGTFQYEGKNLKQLIKDIQPGEGLDLHKIRHYRKGKKTLFINMKASPTKYRDRKAIILAMTNITEMMEKDAQLIQASKMATLGEMSTGVAHELNQPLAAIKLGNMFLRKTIEQEKVIPRKNFIKVVNEVSSHVDRASDIINSLREFGRKSDFIKESQEELDINNPVNGALRIVEHQLNQQNIMVELELDENLPPVMAHNNRLEQVFFNLLTNARDAINQMAEKSEGRSPRVISIRSFKEGKKVAVTITDTGIGIPEEDRDKIFEPFYTNKEPGQNVGLGLSIIYGIVKDYGGEITVQSRKEIGTTLKTAFPHVLSSQGR